MRVLAVFLLALVPSATAGEFPPHGSEQVVDGVLVAADFLHRTGEYRRVDDGKLIDFRMPPFGTLLYLNAEADLRDVPLGTLLHFSLFKDARGEWTEAALIRDDFTMLARDGHTVRIEEIGADTGTLVVSGAARHELKVNGQTRIWKGEKAATLGDLKVGDDLRFNLASGGLCGEVWAGPEAQEQATDRQAEVHRSFLRRRGLAGWIDKVEGKSVTVTLFGDPEGLRGFLKAEGIDPARWASEHRSVDAVVANEELRTYNPPVDRKRAKVLSYEELPTGLHGCGGVRWVIEPGLLLEGFRKGNVIRLFALPSWPVKDMPYGESLYNEAPGFQPDRIDPNLFPYRTDSGNDRLPWYRPKPGEFPPAHSAHDVMGELVSVDQNGRSGRFRPDGSDEEVRFTMPPYGVVQYLDSEAELHDVPTGTRCRFSLHQDDQGAFTRATVITDHFTIVADRRLTYRFDSARLDQGEIRLATQHAPVKDDKEAMIRPPDYGRAIFEVDSRTQVWKDDKPATLDDLAPGDELLLNTSGRSATSRGICTEIWAGVDARKNTSDPLRARHRATLQKEGFPAWVEKVDGKKVTITFFSGRPHEFRALLNGDPGGGGILRVQPCDEELADTGDVVDCTFRGVAPYQEYPGLDGSSGLHWIIEPPELTDDFRPGRILRIHH